jgi:hypothetical protein
MGIPCLVCGGSGFNGGSICKPCLGTGEFPPLTPDMPIPEFDFSGRYSRFHWRSRIDETNLAGLTGLFEQKGHCEKDQDGHTVAHSIRGVYNLMNVRSPM